MKLFLFLICFSFLTTVWARENDLGVFSHNRDIGNPELKGFASYDAISQTYLLKSGGSQLQVKRDACQFLYKEVTGDFILTANFELIGNNLGEAQQLGWMVRPSLADNDAYTSAILQGDGKVLLQKRTSQNATIRNERDIFYAPKRKYQVLQIERSGNRLIMRAAIIGEPLQIVGSCEMAQLPNEVLAGLFIASPNSDKPTEARIWNVRIDKPVTEDYDPYEEGWLGCRLETMNVFDGKRKVIFTKDDRFEAPNWMPDGKELLFNMDGLLYKIPVEGGKINEINTGVATRNNNDHGISFDGKMLAISSHRTGLRGGGSTVYVLPLQGGEPRIVTEDTPSYWHGWGPNNKEIIYVAEREGKYGYNIYKKSIDGGAEIALTDLKEGEHADGCEYSPDGQYIYFNASYSGTMQIWRMKPDGSEKEQLTFDQYNDWFPHISPDGKWIAFISYPEDIPFNSHPSFKRVMLRLMLTSGGAPKVIAHLYGGQGTINVPSWSPDSKEIAFVSNSGKE